MVQRVTLAFDDGQRRELCHDGTGGLYDGGYVVGLANAQDDLAAGGQGELYEWGAFAVTAVTNCRGQCDDCPAS